MDSDNFDNKIIQSENEKDSPQPQPKCEKPNKKGKGKKVKEKISKKELQKRSSLRWVLIIFVITLFISALFSLASETLIKDSNLYIAFIILIILLIINVITDLIATAVTACSEEPFLAMASKKIKGAKKAVKLVRNAQKVSGICGDVVGDICGIISGTALAAIVIKFSISGETKELIISIILSSVIAAVTVGAKALGKRFALSNPQKIVFAVAKILSVFSKE